MTFTIPQDGMFSQTAGFGSVQPLVTVCDISTLTTCYAELNGRLRPESDDSKSRQGMHMSAHTKLFIANVLMTIGALPLVFFVVWLIGILTWTPERGAIIPIMDPIGMIGPFIMGFIITAAVAGTSAAWSWDLVRTNPQNRSRIARVLQLMTVAVLISPFVVLFLSRLL